MASQCCPPDRPGDFVQAMMDLGATICRPRNPRCNACPLKDDCAAFASDDPESFPAPKVGASAAPTRHCLLDRARLAGLACAPAAPRGLLGGMAALPGA